MTDPRPALTLLPGWAYAASVWLPIREVLEQQWRTTAVDLPYQRPAEAWLDAEAEWLADAEPGWILGWSLGGTVALALAARAHPKVRGVVLMASTPCWLPADDAAHGLDEAALNALSDALMSGVAAATLRRFNALVSLGADRPQTIQATLSPHLLLRASAEELSQGLQFMRQTDLRGQHWQVPVAGIWGQGDRLLQRGVGAAWLARHCPHGRTLLNSGHAPAWSQPEAFAQALRHCTANNP